jgi:hypothetical protein
MARSVTLVAGNQNVDLPNGLAYSAANPANGVNITAVASNGTTVTFTTTSPNDVVAGETVELSGLAGGYTSLNGLQTVATSNGTTTFTVTNPTASGATTTGKASVNGPTIYLSDDEGAKLNPNAFTDGVLVDGGTVVGPVRKVTIVAGNYNVQLPNGIVYNATNATGANGPVVYLTVDEGAALVVNSALVDGGWITSGS